MVLLLNMADEAAAALEKEWSSMEEESKEYAAMAAGGS